MMLYRPRLTAPSANLATILAVLALGLVSAPLAAMEEVTVDGARLAAEARAQDARFKSEMDTFAKTVSRNFKGNLAFDLQQSVMPPLRLAGAFAHKRG